MNPADIKLFYHPPERLRLTVGEARSYITVKPVWASPASYPETYLVLLDGSGDEIVMIADPAELSQDALGVVREELRQRYLTAMITGVESVRQEYGATYWTVSTDRGPRDFVTQNLQENAIWYSDHHLMLLDVDGNRFELQDISAMDTRSRDLIEAIL